jgi:hypothetical protein
MLRHIPILPLCDSLLDTGYCRLCASIDQTWTNNATHGPTGRRVETNQNAVPLVLPTGSNKPILDSINSPADMKDLDMRQLKQLAHELRWETLESVSKTGVI